MRNNCAACHTKTLAGQQHIPRLAGQQYDYLKAQLSAFRASTRADMDGVMTSAAQGLSEQDVEVLSDYLSSLAMP
jgi:cytochrome c553